ncbi:MAG TPA: glutaredoxin family protein [bacterium]|nr:glutaredoxin family protein [bacterium]HPJ71826.1 glutaredoxin family protein [bacterium]HPQ66894.1 glutaredoxin family protein [bacterium]
MNSSGSVCRDGACRIDPAVLAAAREAGQKTVRNETGPGVTVLIFSKSACPVCEEAKAAVKTVLENRERVAVVEHDLDTVDGLVEGSLRNALEVPTVIVLREGEESVRWEAQAPPAVDLEKALGAAEG